MTPMTESEEAGMQFEFKKFKTPPDIGHSIFIGGKGYYIVLSLNLRAKTGCARPFTPADNLRDPLFPIRATASKTSKLLDERSPTS